MANEFFGRRQIFTSVSEITPQNVVDVLNKAFATHTSNAAEIQYLYDYYKGYQPIFNRVKTQRPEICNKIVINRAQEIVSFKTGYLVGEPIQYVARSNDPEVSENVSLLNTYMAGESKAARDKELVEWQEICGTSYRMTLPDSSDEADECPFEVYTLDPRNTFVVYDNSFRRKPIMNVNYVVNDDGKYRFSVYTKPYYYEIENGAVVVQMINGLGMLPIIEYPANPSRLGSFEIVLDILDAVNLTESNRLDGIEQFIQSLLIFYNCQLGEDSDGNEITPQMIREQGAIFIKSIGENKADIKEISEQLDQQQTQTLVDSMEHTWRTIVGIPSQSDANGSESSNNGAIIFKNGWQGAETRAKERELTFIPCEMEFLKLALHICRKVADIDLKLSDIIVKFTRRNYSDLLSKSQVLTTMLASEKIAPIDAYVSCGLFPDPEDAARRGMEWYENNKQSTKETENADEGENRPVDESNTEE